ncbi:MAG: tetratricopeptide repeat protein [Thermoanaerobaculia bacterium]|nr:MAG: tetratricopeptide repeat protein [Thermoanaerobaculia bacterium]
MRKSWLIGIALAIVIGGAIWIEASRREPWTTDSPQALAEYLRGRQAAMKVYQADAAAAYERALELDPSFVAAKLGLLESDRDKNERKRLLDELRGADRSRLTELENFLLDVVFARTDGDEARRREVVEAYLAKHPRDPWALHVASADAWARQDWPSAEARYRRLLEVDPNWLLARNHLGYIAMAQGRFREAEDEFRTYRFAAPDQANPHDSLGELLVLLGRYDEARAELEEALRIRPDFCASYFNLLRIAVLERRPEDVDPLVARIERHCDERTAAVARCDGTVAKAFLTGDDDAPWRETGEVCETRYQEPDVLLHILALRSGRREEALAMEEKAKKRLAELEGGFERAKTGYRVLVSFLEAERLFVEGRFEEAVPKLREVDADSTWWEAEGRGTIKLVARILLYRSLGALGDRAGAEEALARARAVNPDFAAWYSTFDPYLPRAGTAPAATPR